MIYRVVLARQAIKHLERFPKNDQASLKKVLYEMATEPFSGDVVKLSGTESYRRRVGTYRILFYIHREVLLVLILDIKRRNDKTYKKL